MTTDSNANGNGHFDEDGWSFTVTDPGTPRPWCNVICNGRYGLVVSHNGGGFSWYDDAQHNVLTRWEMDLVRDCYGKFLYLADTETGAVWSAAPAPCFPSFDLYRCTHEPGVTTFRASSHGIDAVWELCVAPEDGAELWAVTLTNTGKASRRLRVSSYFEWTCGVAPDSKREFHRLFFTTEHDVGRRAIVATKNMWDIPGLSERDHWNVPWPYAAAHAVGGDALVAPIALADKGRFLGRYGSTASPRALIDGAGERIGGFGRFGDACAALGGEVTIAPGATAKVHFVIAVAADKAGALAVVDRFVSRAVVDRTFEAARAAWRERLAGAKVRSGRPDFDLLVNTWLPYQAISGRLWGRTGYYQQSGARGFRDQLQDSQVWLPTEPQRCADQLMLHASRQFTDGSVNHWWHALANFGNHTECSDDYLWLAFVAAAYLKETGDYGVLERRAPFLDGGDGPLIDHCSRAIERSFRRMSERGLPLIGSCDWNDGLSALGLAGKGESVWLAMFLCSILRDWETIYARVGDRSRSETSARRRESLLRAIEAHAWDPAGYYRCATKDSGEWVGASSSPEGKIHLNPQTWSILAGVASAERAGRAWLAVKRELLTPFGPLLLAPAYTTPDPDIGYITRYAPGTRENGGVYMHAATWALAAACAVRDHDAVESIWSSVSPPVRCGNDPEAYWAEPYVLPGNVDGPLSDLPGRAGWTWYTGSAAWLRRVAHEWMLGVRPVFTREGEGLLVDPVPPASLGLVRFERPWRGARLTVEFDARSWAPGVTPRVRVNGEDAPGGVITEDVARRHRGGSRVEVAWRNGGASAPHGRAGAAAPAGRAT